MRWSTAAGGLFRHREADQILAVQQRLKNFLFLDISCRGQGSSSARASSGLACSSTARPACSRRAPSGTSALASGPSPMPPYSFGTKRATTSPVRAPWPEACRALSSGCCRVLFKRGCLLSHPLTDLFSDSPSLQSDSNIDRHGISLATSVELAEGHNAARSHGKPNKVCKARNSSHLAQAGGGWGFSDGREDDMTDSQTVSRLSLPNGSTPPRQPSLARGRRQGAAAVLRTDFPRPSDVAPGGAAKLATSFTLIIADITAMAGTDRPDSDRTTPVHQARDGRKNMRGRWSGSATCMSSSPATNPRRRPRVVSAGARSSGTAVAARGARYS